MAHQRPPAQHRQFGCSLIAAVELVLLLASGLTLTTKAEFNYEVEKRVIERINDYMNGPRIASGISSKFRTNGGFPNDMDARDRDAYSRFSYALMQEFKFDMLYFGLEDGTFLGHGVGWGTYREPGIGGYAVTEPSQQKYFDACVDRQTGEDRNCTMAVGDKYIQCVRNCALMKCADEETQACVSIDIPELLMMGETADPSVAHCRSKTSSKWCRQYEVAEVTPVEEGSRGFVPRTYYCHDAKGLFTERPGKALKSGFLEEYGSSNIVLGDCEYEDGSTKVERYEVGNYVYCNNGGACVDAFDGGYRSRDYDPRYRTWYIQTKESQMPNWSPPYPFFSNLDLGITYSHPIYSNDPESGRYIFEGVLGVDYTFADIGKFLKEGYFGSSTVVVVYEEKEPNFIVASSSGRKAATKVLAEDESQPCPDSGSSDTGNCVVVRESMAMLAGSTGDSLLVKAYEEQRVRDYPRELLTVKVNEDDIEDDVYIVQSTFYRPGGDLEWIILVISPAGTANSDALTKENSLFGLVCVVASLGFILCLAMFIQFFRKRHERAVILADWRFTSAFLLGCALLNISSFTLLGENTDALCLTRMWSFHFLFALALSPLFVKVWRMWRMVGTPNRRPTVVNNLTAALLALPIVAFQTLILVIFTFADPPQQEEIIEIEDGIVTQRIVCSQSSSAFDFVMIIFEAGLVLIGCVLAYVTRNLESQFGEAKPLMFSMYNIAFIGIITVVIIYTMAIDATGQIVLRSIGVFWGTVFSSAAFVLPRLMRVKEEKKQQQSSILKKSQKSVNGASALRNSKVRFSVDDDKSSVVSENACIDDSEATEPKSNTKTDKKTNSITIESLDVKKQSEESAGAFQDSFIQGTGWPVYETPTAEVGRWEDEGDSEEEAQETGDGEEHDGSTSKSNRSVEESAPSESSMAPLQEGGMSESSRAGEERPAGDDNC